MRFLLLGLSLILFFPGVANPQAGGRAKPPGITTADTMANARSKLRRQASPSSQHRTGKRRDARITPAGGWLAAAD